MFFNTDISQPCVCPLKTCYLASAQWVTFGISCTLYTVEARINLYDEKGVVTLCNKHVTGVEK